MQSPSRPLAASPGGPCLSPARRSRRSRHTECSRTTDGAQPQARGGTTAPSSPPRSGHRWSPAAAATVRDPGRESRPRGRPPAHAAALGRQPPAGGRYAHEGRPRAPRTLALRHHRGHLQPRRSGSSARGGRPARRGAPVVTVAVLRPRCCIHCCSHARGGPAFSADPPLTCGFAVG